MRSDARCSGCSRPIRWAEEQTTGRPVMLDPAADHTADIGIVAWGESHDPKYPLPIVSKVGTDAHTETPMRYRAHYCTFEVMV